MSAVATRRHFLASAGIGAGSLIAGDHLPAVLTAAGYPVPPRTRLAATSAGLPKPDKNRLLLNRATFGVHPQDTLRLEELGYTDWLDEQLDYRSIDDKAEEKQVKQLFPSTAYDFDQLSFDERLTISLELKSATAHRALYSKRQLFEVMVEFWSNHFNIYHIDGPVVVLKTIDDRDVIRTHALGRFPDLLLASAKSPAMLYYLDNYANHADGPNENYARELMELHTLGSDNGYTQQDVQEVARCFTGWTIDNRRVAESYGNFIFVPKFHDFGAKTVLGHTIPAGGGVSDGETVLQILAAHANTADHIAFKLCRRFAGDSPSQGLVNKAAKTFRQTGGDISAVVRAILTSASFKKSFDSKFKRPVEFLVSAMRSLEAQVQPNASRVVLGLLRGMGQLPFDWHAPNGYPDVAGAWANTNGLLTRWNIGLALGANMVLGVVVNYPGMLDKAGVSTPRQLVELFRVQLTGRDFARADEQILLDWAAGNGDPDKSASRTKLLQKIPGLVALILDSPYFQMR